MFAEAALFDLGGVLIDWDPASAYREAFPDSPVAVQRFLEGPLTTYGLASCETRGALSAIVSELHRPDAELDPLAAFFVEHWNAFVRGPMPESVAVFGRMIDAGVPAWGLTNWPEATFPPSGEAFGFLDHFTDIVVSGREGLRKPHEAIFRLAIERFGLEPARTVYVDDHEGNVQTAQRLGFIAHRFVDAPALESFLEVNGLLPASSGEVGR